MDRRNPPVEQTGVEVEDRVVPEGEQFNVNTVPEDYGKKPVRKEAKPKVKAGGPYKATEAKDFSQSAWDRINKQLAATEAILNNQDQYDPDVVEDAYGEMESLTKLINELDRAEKFARTVDPMVIDEYFADNEYFPEDEFDMYYKTQPLAKIVAYYRAMHKDQRFREEAEDYGYGGSGYGSSVDDSWKSASMRGENMEDVMKAKQAGLGDFKDTPESEKKEHKPAPKKEGPKIADVGSFGDGTEAESTPLPPPEPRRKQADLSGNIVKDKPLGSENNWSTNPTAPTAQIRLDEVEERPPEPEAPSPQMSLDQGWTSTAPQFDPLARVKDYGVNMFGSMQLQDWYKALMATDPTSPEYANQLKALQFRIGFDPNISELERTIYGPLLKRAEANMGVPAFKSFREEMEKSISDKDAAAGIPTGFMGTHPMTSPYKRVELGYGKDATYPFVLRNALTGEKVCDVTDNPRENSN